MESFQESKEKFNGNKWQSFLHETDSEEYNVTQYDVDELRKMTEADEMIPRGILPKVFLLALIAFDNNKGKSLDALHHYYKMKSEMPEYLADRDVESREFQETLANQCFAVLPPTPKNFIAILMKLSNFEPKLYNFDESFKVLLAIIGEIFNLTSFPLLKSEFKKWRA
jgi:hypothetical protein